MADTISVSIPDDEKEIMEWVEQQVDEKKFSSVSHAVRYCIHQVKEGEKKEVLA